MVFGLNDIQGKMSSEQYSLYVVDQDTLTFIMLASVCGTVLIALVIFAVQLRALQKRMSKIDKAWKQLERYTITPRRLVRGRTEVLRRRELRRELRRGCLRSGDQPSLG